MQTPLCRGPLKKQHRVLVAAWQLQDQRAFEALVEGADQKLRKRRFLKSASGNEGGGVRQRSSLAPMAPNSSKLAGLGQAKIQKAAP